MLYLVRVQNRLRMQGDTVLKGSWSIRLTVRCRLDGLRRYCRLVGQRYVRQSADWHTTPMTRLLQMYIRRHRQQLLKCRFYMRCAFCVASASECPLRLRDAMRGEYATCRAENVVAFCSRNDFQWRSHVSYWSDCSLERGSPTGERSRPLLQLPPLATCWNRKWVAASSWDRNKTVLVACFRNTSLLLTLFVCVVHFRNRTDRCEIGYLKRLTMNFERRPYDHRDLIGLKWYVTNTMKIWLR